jgi:cell division septal protein FtsQ
MSRLKIVGVAVTLAALYGGWHVMRDSSLFAVRQVTITGLAGPQAPAIRATLEDAARGMTTLDMQLGRLRSSVSSFAVVKDVRARTRFPHGVTIAVVLEAPVAALVVSGQRLPVAADGRIVRGIGSVSGVTSIPVTQLPTGDRISDPTSVDAVELLDIAPAVLRARISTVTLGAHGLTAQLRGGPALYFGDTTRLHAKWAALARVLSDPAARGAVYVDVHTPDRPAAQVGDPFTSGPAVDAPGTAGGALVSGSAIGTPVGG